MTAYHVYDVFTDRAFGGNQLAVIPDTSALNSRDFQSIAREFNYSETTFVLPPQDPANTARVRIFTPGSELQFAGHPTIGTAITLRDLGHQGPMVLELGVGPIPCQFNGDIASFTTAAPLDRLTIPDPDTVARALGLEPNALSDSHAPIEAGLGTPFVLVPLRDRDALRRCQPNTEAMRAGAAVSSDQKRFAVLAYVDEGATIHARMFAPLGGIPEDPATGSAAAALAAFLHENRSAPQSFTIHQGDDMGRPSRITVSTRACTPVRVTISGQAVKTMEGRLVL